MPMLSSLRQCCLFFDIFVQRPMASLGTIGQKESGCQWHLTELNGLMRKHI